MQYLSKALLILSLFYSCRMEGWGGGASNPVRRRRDFGGAGLMETSKHFATLQGPICVFEYSAKSEHNDLIFYSNKVSTGIKTFINTDSKQKFFM